MSPATSIANLLVALVVLLRIALRYVHLPGSCIGGKGMQALFLVMPRVSQSWRMRMGLMILEDEDGHGHGHDNPRG